MSNRKVRRIAKETGLPVVKIMVRGGTYHRKDLCLEDGTITRLFIDGTIYKTNDRWK